MRYEIYDNYKEYRNGYCNYETDDEEEAFGIKKRFRKCVVYDNVTHTFLE